MYPSLILLDAKSLDEAILASCSQPSPSEMDYVGLVAPVKAARLACTLTRIA